MDSHWFLSTLVLAYSVGFSLYSTVRYFGLQTTAWDAGAYNQALYTTLFSGKLFYYTADLPANPAGSLLGIHFSPILLAIAPFYLALPSPVTLFLAQSVAVGVGAVPLYYIARDRLDDTTMPAILAIAYLISPMSTGVNWFNFHPEAFVPASVLGAIYFWTKGKWVMYFLCFVIALSAIETAPVIMGGFGLYLAWRNRGAIVSLWSLRDLRKPAAFVPLASVALSASWLLTALAAIRILNPINVFYFGGSPRYWSILGARNIGQVPVRVLVDPTAALAALSFDGTLKLLYFVALFGPLLFLPLLSRPYTLLTIPWLAVALVSGYLPFYNTSFQYVAFVSPFIFAGAVEGFRRLENAQRRPRWLSSANVRRLFLTSAVLGFLAFTPVIPWLMGASGLAPPYSVFSPGSHESLVREAVSLIPPDASVLTQPNIFPLVSSRVNAFTVPIVSLFPHGTSFNATFTQWLNESTYVLLDPTTDPVSTLLTLPRIRQLNIHGLFAQFNDVLLFKKSYAGSPIVFRPAEETLDWKDLNPLNAVVVSDPNSTVGRALFHEKGRPGPFWNSSDVLLPAGSYTATFRFRADQNWTGNLLQACVAEYADSVVSTPFGNDDTGYNYLFGIRKDLGTSSLVWLSSMNFTAGAYRGLTVQLVSNGMESFSFRGQALTNMSSIYLDSIVIHQNPL